MASQADWLYRAIVPMSRDWRARVDLTQRYGDVAIRPLIHQDRQAGDVPLS